MNEDKKVFDYLNTLRETGITNMYGAGPYIENAFKVDRNEAKRLLEAWMKQF